ncbi:dynamin family protein [Xylariomycetidae sp. FL0641]|nr:dynamin family protein [Xylariomycetidae sp. FL0641]
MVLSFGNEILQGLCSADQLELLNAVDRLRLQGLDHYVSLPQIIVCGDQSSGKSSVLEAISGVPFPVKSNLCTRFPTELVLRRTTKRGVAVSIVPHSSLGLSEQSRLSGFNEKLDGFEGFPALIEKAKVVMGISTHGKSFSKDLLRVEICGPDRPHLTIVDLPGLIHSETKQQSAADVELVTEVVTSYMKQSRSIILAVISAKNDFANQIVLKLARKADPSGYRTMGIITKPDTLVPGSASEEIYASLAKNNEVEFRLGWHVLRNMDSDLADGESLLPKRDAEEAEFFSSGIWQQLDSSMLGISELRPKLSNVLLRQITRELPGLIRDIDKGHADCEKKLKDLGKPRVALDEQRLELLRISQAFQLLVKSSVDGTYSHAFFESAKTARGYQQRIRAVIQNLNKKFSGILAVRGHKRVISHQNSTAIALTPEPIQITREKFIDHARVLMERTRARELPGLFNPMVVSDLFHEQSEPWDAIVSEHIDSACEAAKKFLELVVYSVAGNDLIAKALLEEVFEPAFKKVWLDAEAKVTELLDAHRIIHPITYNHQYSEAIQKVKKTRREEQAAKVVQTFFKLNTSPLSVLGTTKLNDDYNLFTLIQKLAERNEEDIERSAASEALDCMHAYYNVAMKRFTDDVAVEVIEEKLLAGIGEILSPVAVFNMTPKLVESIAGEPRQSRVMRKKLTKQLDVLKKGSETCKRFADLQLDDDSDFLEPDEEDVDDDSGEATPES